MPTSTDTLTLLLAIGLVCALFGKSIQGNPRGGIIVSIVIGFAGAVLGPWAAISFKLPRPMLVDIHGHPFSILWATIGSAACVAVLHMFSNRYSSRGRAQ